MLSCDFCSVSIKRHYDLIAFYRLTSEPIVCAIIANGTPGAADSICLKNRTKIPFSAKPYTVSPGVIDRYRCYLRPVTAKMIRQIIPRRIHTVRQTGGSCSFDFRTDRFPFCLLSSPPPPRRPGVSGNHSTTPVRAVTK